MDPKLAVYLAYAVVTLALTLWVGHTLQRHGQAFLRDVLPTGSSPPPSRSSSSSASTCSTSATWRSP
ncbi:hypothetical protein ACFQZ4_22745 [Catellatospora coxensis]